MVRSSSFTTLLLCTLAFCCSHYAGAEVKFVWPTPNAAFAEGKPLESFAQPTVSGEAESALFGCVRNNGSRFHEGVDLKATKHDRRGEALDEVFAAIDGRVAYINTVGGRSSYGRYIVLEHPGQDLAVYTLYAHLQRVEPGLAVGQTILAGGKLGTMGRSASYGIPRERSHLHFEVGLRLSDNFQDWYDDQDYEQPNYFGKYNGMNLTGFEPLRFSRLALANKVESMSTYVLALPTAYTLRVQTGLVPDFVKRYPALLSQPIASKSIAGWDIEFTWYGLPKRWTPVFQDKLSDSFKAGRITLLDYNPDLLERSDCRGTIVLTSAGPQLGSGARHVLEVIFGFR